MKRIIILLFITIFTTACSVDVININDFDEVLSYLSNQELNSNQNANGYKYYLPTNMLLEEVLSNNHILYSDGVSYYMYVDTISYFYQNMNEVDYNQEDVFYFKKLEYDDKIGYIKIEEYNIDSQYHIVVNFNYVTLEALVLDKNIENSIYLMIEIANNVQYNDEVIEKSIVFTNNNTKTEIYDIFSKDEEQVDYLEYLKEYDTYEDYNNELPDEDLIQTEE